MPFYLRHSVDKNCHDIKQQEQYLVNDNIYKCLYNYFEKNPYIVTICQDRNNLRELKQTHDSEEMTELQSAVR